MYQAWVNLNYNFLLEDGRIVKSMGCYCERRRIVLEGHSFGMPPDSLLLVPGRVELLQRRYRVRANDLKAFHENKSSGARALRIERRKIDNRPMPKAGGCMLSVVVMQNGEVLVTSRAAEITLALYHDILYMRELMQKLGVKVNKVTWVIGSATQNRLFVPVFIFDQYKNEAMPSHGPGRYPFFRRWLRSGGKTEWEKICVEHARDMLSPQVKMQGTRLRWARRLREWMK